MTGWDVLALTVIGFVVIVVVVARSEDRRRPRVCDEALYHPETGKVLGRCNLRENHTAAEHAVLTRGNVERTWNGATRPIDLWLQMQRDRRRPDGGPGDLPTTPFP